MKKTNKKTKEQPKKIKVGILGATGTVGQKFIVALTDHPWFEVTALAASKGSAGQSYGKLMASRWKQEKQLPEEVAKMIVQEAKPNLKCDFVFSGLDAAIAGPIEESFAKAGYPVISNTRNYRMEDDVPLVVPEVNADHFQVIDRQRAERKWRGFITTNPNCVAIPLSLALKPVFDKFGISKISVVTMQAISGAGYPGVASLDILDNVLPYIGGEEPKVESEPLKLFSELKKSGGFKLPNLKISAQCNRVAVKDGHLLNIAFNTKKPAKLSEIKKAIKSFKGEPQKLKLPSAPKKPLVYIEDDFRPQPRLDRDRDGGMAISIGRLREDSILGFKMVVLGHNTMRGAAGAAILNAELLYKKGYLKKS